MRYDIVYVFDEAYASHFGASVTSLLAHFTENFDRLHIHVVTTHVCDSIGFKIERLEERFGCHFHLNFINQTHHALLSELPLNNSHMDYMAPMTWVRLLLPSLLPNDIDRVVYLDADTIVLESISHLFSEFVDAIPLLGVADISEQNMADLHGVRQYINSGVLLMQLGEWRKQGYSEGCLALARERVDDLWYADQCTLNLFLHEHIQKIPYYWNQFVTSGSMPTHIKRGIIHFIGKQKPWHFSDNRLPQALYWQYRDMFFS